jgi:hypothetical protein
MMGGQAASVQTGNWANAKTVMIDAKAVLTASVQGRRSSEFSLLNPRQIIPVPNKSQRPVFGLNKTKEFLHE